MRWTWAAAAVMAAAWAAPGAAWAGEDEGKVVAREEYVVVLDGLEAEQLERCVAELKKNHPGVEVKVREGVLRLRGTDANAFEMAMHALRGMGVPTGEVLLRPLPERGEKAGKGEKPKAGAKPKKIREAMGPDAPSDADFAAKIEAIEQRLHAAREAGREREVAELEQALERVRTMRKEVAAARAAAGARREGPDGGPRLEDLRRRLEEAKRAFDMAVDERAAQSQRPEAEKRAPRATHARLDVQAHEMGPRRQGPAVPPELRQRMEHTRQALKHLREAGLHEQAQHVERALHRMELAAQGPGEGEPRGPGEVRAVEVMPARRGGDALPPPMPPPAPAIQEPPPNVRGVNRGKIQHRKAAPRVQPPPPPGAPVPPMPPAPPRGAMVVVEREPGAADAPRRILVPGAMGGPHGPGPGAGRGPDGAAREIEALRRELEQLKRQLHELVHHLEQPPRPAR